MNISVKEALTLLGEAEQVDLSFAGDLVCFNFRKKIEVEAWGDYMVKNIYAVKTGVFELALDAYPIRKV